MPGLSPRSPGAEYCVGDVGGERGDRAALLPQIGKYFKRVKQANASLDAAGRAIDGFVFQVCEVSV